VFCKEEKDGGRKLALWICGIGSGRAAVEEREEFGSMWAAGTNKPGDGAEGRCSRGLDDRW